MQSLSELEARSSKGVPSLVELARKTCQRHSHQIQDIGDTPYHLIEPVLRKFKCRQMLHIESISPHIARDSEPVWKHFISRDFSDRPLPKKNFKETYLRYQEEKEARLKESSDRLKRNIAREQQRKSEIMITQLDVDPRAESSQRRQYMQRAKSSVVGRLRLEMRSKGSMFSPSNPTFLETNRKSFFDRSNRNQPRDPPREPPAPRDTVRVNGGFNSDHRISSIPVPVEAMSTTSLKRPLKRPTPMPKPSGHSSSGSASPTKIQRTDMGIFRRPETAPVVTSTTPPQSPPPLSRHVSPPLPTSQAPAPPLTRASPPPRRQKPSSIFITRKK
ncbi:Elongin-A [Yarrowia sp. B02]|nr:Elongin-A [Yarrowia sp. B02]